MLKIILLTILTIPISVAFAVERKPISDVQSDKLIKETQKQLPDNGPKKHLALAWWVPSEFWRVALNNDPNLSKSQKDEIFSLLNDYFLLAIVQSDVTALGAFEFYTKKEIESNLNVTFSNKVKENLEVIPLEKIDQNVEILLQQITPILGAAMGNLGDNFHFYVFDDTNNTNGRLIDPYFEGILNVNLKKRSGEQLKTFFEMPLNSLFIPRLCPNGKEAHVSWRYCPWSGKKIK